MTEPFNYSGKLSYLQRVCRDPRLTRTATAVASVLVEYADRNTGKAYPSIDRIVEETGIGKSTCIRGIKLLEQCEHLTAARRAGSNNLYILTGSEGGTSAGLGTGVSWNATGVISNLRAGKTGVTTGTDPAPTPEPEQRKALKATGKEQTTRVRESRFLEFWEAYPRHEGGKEKCETTWLAGKLDASADLILADLAARKADAGQWLSIEKRFIPHPKTYLNGRRWEDEWTPAAAPSGTLPRESASDDDIAAMNANAALRMGGANG